MKSIWNIMASFVCVVTAITLTSCKTFNWEDIWPTDDNNTPVVNNPEEVAHNFDITKCNVEGQFDFRNAKVTVKAKTLSVSGADIAMTWDKHVWPMYDEYCDGLIVCIWKRSTNDWLGGYIDWCPAGREGYSWDCIPNFYNYGSPSKGDECGFFILSYDKQQRSDALFTTWPIDSPSALSLRFRHKIPSKPPKNFKK